MGSSARKTLQWRVFSENGPVRPRRGEPHTVVWRSLQKCLAPRCTPMQRRPATKTLGNERMRATCAGAKLRVLRAGRQKEPSLGSSSETVSIEGPGNALFWRRISDTSEPTASQSLRRIKLSFAASLKSAGKSAAQRFRDQRGSGLRKEIVGAALRRPPCLPISMGSNARETVQWTVLVVRAPGKLSSGEFSARTGPVVRDGTQCTSIGRARLSGPGRWPAGPEGFPIVHSHSPTPR